MFPIPLRDLTIESTKQTESMEPTKLNREVKERKPEPKRGRGRGRGGRGGRGRGGRGGQGRGISTKKMVIPDSDSD